MEKFNKYDNLVFALRKKEGKNPNAFAKKYSYIWEYDQIDDIVAEILQKGKKITDNEWRLKNKNDEYFLSLISIKKSNKKVIELLNKTNDLNNQIKDLEVAINTKEELIKKLEKDIEELNIKAVTESLVFKQEALNIQKKAQDAINEYKLKANEHQQEQIKEAKLYALQSFIEKLIHPLNNFEIAINAATKIDNDVLRNFIVGFNMLYKKVEDTLIDIGLSKIIPKVGDSFDPNIHQVYELVNSDLEKDKILEIKNIGYKLHDRVIKPALVIVSK